MESRAEDAPVSAGAAEASGRMPTSAVVVSALANGDVWHALLDALPVGILLLDEGLRVAFSNAAFFRQFSEIAPGDGIEAFFPRAEIEAARGRLRGTGTVRVVGPGTTRTGSTRVGLDLTLLRMPEHDYVCVACHPAVFEDARGLERCAETADHPVRLGALQRQAVITNLAAAVAHEVNNMLSVVMASAELAGRLAQRAEDPTDDLERVEEASERAAEVLGDLLRFMGKRGTEPEELEPRAAISALSRLIESSVRRGIQLRLRLEPTRLVRVLRTEFESSLLALIDNAREALGGSGHISVVSEERSLVPAEAQELGLTAGAYASVRITDSGPGMSHEVVLHAAEPYFTTKGSVVGAGIGLTAARAFAQTAGGGLVLTSAPGRGTTTELLLPLL